MIDRLLSQSPTALLERSASFHAARHKVIGENVVNVSTPGYRTKDLDVAGFQRQLRSAIDNRGRDGSMSVRGISVEAGPTNDNLVFHDGNDRSVEQLLGDQAENALRHNMTTELLRKHYGLFHMALRERVA
jgi:flagellar basal body rod protein FlgB